MPIFPVTKIPTPPVPQFAEYVFINSLHDLFVGSGSLKIQPLPFHTTIDEEVDDDVLEIFRDEDDSVQFPAPTNGVFKKFRYFQIENNTAFTFDVNFINVTQATTTTILTAVGFGVANDKKLFKNDALEIPVIKGDLINYEINFGTNTPASLKHIHQVYFSANFKPTSSA
jgi:hypothetical protein